MEKLSGKDFKCESGWLLINLAMISKLIWMWTTSLVLLENVIYNCTVIQELSSLMGNQGNQGNYLLSRCVNKKTCTRKSCVSIYSREPFQQIKIFKKKH